VLPITRPRTRVTPASAIASASDPSVAFDTPGSPRPRIQRSSTTPASSIAVTAALVRIRRSGPSASSIAIDNRSFVLEAGILGIAPSCAYRIASSSPIATET
jgi:hypothetical protein